MTMPFGSSPKQKRYCARWAERCRLRKRPYSAQLSCSKPGVQPRRRRGGAASFRRWRDLVIALNSHACAQVSRSARAFAVRIPRRSPTHPKQSPCTGELHMETECIRSAAGHVKLDIVEELPRKHEWTSGGSIARELIGLFRRAGVTFG